MRQSGTRWLVMVAAMVAALGMAACAAENHEATEGEGEHGIAEGAAEHARGEGAEGSDEHARSEGEGEHGEAGHDEEGEESGVYISREDVWDTTRRGARLVLSFDPASNAFVGNVENTTGEKLCAARVEVHLSTGTELGPTERTDLEPGEETDVRLPTGGEAFESWTAHPEVSACSGG